MVESQRIKSKIPCSATNTESTVLNAKIDDIWSKVRVWKLDDLAPNQVTRTEWTDGEAGRVDSVVKVTYTNGADWFLRVTELSERNHTCAYELVQAEPATSVSSIVGAISLEAVTDTDQTFLTWHTEYSNDVDMDFIVDAKWKKRDYFDDMKATIAAQATSNQ